MKLFNNFQKIDDNIWGEAFKASPSVYEKPEGDLFGAYALTEEVDTILPKNPKETVMCDGKIINDWQLVLVSTTKDSILMGSDYYELLMKLRQFMIDEDEDAILIKGLSLSQMESLM